jgi:hypothetical protein
MGGGGCFFFDVKQKYAEKLSELDAKTLLHNVKRCPKIQSDNQKMV